MLGYDMYMLLSGGSQSDISGRHVNTDYYTKKFVSKLIAFEKDLVKQHDSSFHKLQSDSIKPIKHDEDVVIKEIMQTLESEPEMNQIKQMVNAIREQLPQLPSAPVPDKTNPPPYVKKPIVVGEQIPVGKDQRAKPKPKPVRKNNKEKPIKFEGKFFLIQTCLAKNLTQNRRSSLSISNR
jgi:hypothetical protein